MKYPFILLSALIVLASCGTSKNVDTEPPSGGANTVVQKEDTQQDQNQQGDEQTQNTGQKSITMANGFVRDLSKEGCGYVIEVLVDNVNNKSSYLQPLSLPETYQADGKAIRFVFRMSRRASDCVQASPIIIDKILE